jgi:hypothetical protein
MRNSLRVERRIPASLLHQYFEATLRIDRKEFGPALALLEGLA